MAEHVLRTSQTRRAGETTALQLCLTLQPLVYPRGGLKMPPSLGGNFWATGNLVKGWSNPLLGNQA